MTEDNSAFSATIKAGGGFEAPWIVIRANTAEELKARLHEAYSGLVGPLLATAEVFANEYQGGSKPAATPNPGNQSFGNQSQGSSNGFGGQANTGGNQGGGGFGGNQGGGTPEPTHVPRPHCAHGEMAWKSGNRKADNKPYAFWTCQSNDRNNQCKPEFPPR